MPTVKPDLRSCVTHDGAMILDISADEVITLNGTAGYVWARLEERITVDQIIEELAANTGQDPAGVGVDVREFIEQIVAKKLVTL